MGRVTNVCAALVGDAVNIVPRIVVNVIDVGIIGMHDLRDFPDVRSARVGGAVTRITIVSAASVSDSGNVPVGRVVMQPSRMPLKISVI